MDIDRGGAGRGGREGGARGRRARASGVEWSSRVGEGEARQVAATPGIQAWAPSCSAKEWDG